MDTPTVSGDVTYVRFYCILENDILANSLFSNTNIYLQVCNPY